MVIQRESPHVFPAPPRSGKRSFRATSSGPRVDLDAFAGRTGYGIPTIALSMLPDGKDRQRFQGRKDLRRGSSSGGGV